MDTCDFKSDLAFGKVGEQQVSTILTECNIKHGPNPDKYGHDILRVNKSTGNRNQSAWFKVNGIEMIDFEEYIRGWKIEQNNSWGFLKPDTGIRR